MGQITITLPEELRDALQVQAEDGGYATPDAYVAALIYQRQVERLRELVLEGIASPIVGDADDAFWTNLRRRVTSGE